MARLNLIICDLCKEKAEPEKFFFIRINPADDSEEQKIFEVCQRCASKIIKDCETPPELGVKKKEEPVTRTRVIKSEPPKETKCEHVNKTFEPPDKLKCDSCNAVLTE